MLDFFNFFGSILGYLLWWLYIVFKNYGVAIIFFTLITKALVFPFSLKQQKSMASQSKLSGKQKELQKRYANNKQKYNEELQKLYEKEGVNPASGCLTTMLPFPIMFGIYYSVINPLTNTLHLAKESIEQATNFITNIPGITTRAMYPEMEIIKNWDLLRSYMEGIFSPAEVSKMDSFSTGFNFLGLNLLNTPSNSPLESLMILIPIISLAVSFGTQFYMMRSNPQQQQMQGQQAGCMKVMMFIFPLISVYYSWQFPGAIGFYWIMSGLAGFAQTIVTNKLFSVNHMTARSEASRAVTLELAEAKIKPLSAAAQMQISQQIEASEKAQQNQGQKDGKKKNTGKKPAKKPGNTSSSNDYRGNKK